MLPAGAEEVHGGAGGGPADGVVEDGGPQARRFEVFAGRARPVGAGVVEGEVRAVGPRPRHLRRPPASAITVAPAFFAYWTTRVPIPPAAAVTTTTESGPSGVNPRMPRAVRPVPIMATAPAASSPSGISWSRSASVTVSSAYPPGAMPMWATTRLPSQAVSVPPPTDSTVPATSRPGTVGSSTAVG